MAKVLSRAYLRVRARLQILGSRLLDLPGMELIRRTYREMGDDHAIDLAAAIAYYAILSLLPLAIGLVSVFSLVLESGTVEEDVYAFFHYYLPGSDGILEANVEAVSGIRGILGIFSFIGLLWSSTLLFGAVTRAVNRAWDIEYDRPFYIEKPRQILMAVSVAPVFMISITLTTGLQVLGSENIPVLGSLSFLEHNGINALARPLPFMFSLTIFLFIYKFTPIAHTYWRYIWPGASLAALLFEIAKSVFVFYLENYAPYEKIYGTLASVIALMVWAYVSGLIVVVGGRGIIRVLPDKSGARLVGARPPPSTQDHRPQAGETASREKPVGFSCGPVRFAHILSMSVNAACKAPERDRWNGWVPPRYPSITATPLEFKVQQGNVTL